MQSAISDDKMITWIAPRVYVDILHILSRPDAAMLVAKIHCFITFSEWLVRAFGFPATESLNVPIPHHHQRQWRREGRRVWGRDGRDVHFPHASLGETANCFLPKIQDKTACIVRTSVNVGISILAKGIHTGWDEQRVTNHNICFTGKLSPSGSLHSPHSLDFKIRLHVVQYFPYKFPFPFSYY